MNTQTVRNVLAKGFGSERGSERGSGTQLRPPRDPQWELHGTLIEGTEMDQIIFDMPLLRFMLTCLVTIPDDRSRVAPVFLQHNHFPPRVRQQGEKLPQDEVEGKFWEGRNSNCILFHFDIMLFRFFCIVSIPGEGNKHSKIYVAHKIVSEPRGQ